EPIRPDSSAPHQAKRSLFGAWTLAMFRATSSSAAEPDPLSLMPGPAVTPSRWAPDITTLSGSPHGLSAMTFSVVRNSRNVSVATCAIVPGWLSVTPSSNDAADDRDGDGAGRLLAERADDQVQAPGVVALVE